MSVLSCEHPHRNIKGSNMNYINIENMTVEEVMAHIREVSPNTLTGYIIVGNEAVPISVSREPKSLQVVER